MRAKSSGCAAIGALLSSANEMPQIDASPDIRQALLARAWTETMLRRYALTMFAASDRHGEVLGHRRNLRRHEIRPHGRWRTRGAHRAVRQPCRRQDRMAAARL